VCVALFKPFIIKAPEDSTSTPPNALKTIISAAESAATWFGVSSKPGGASEWGLRAGAANTDDLLGDMDAGEEQLLNQSSGLSRRKTMSIRRRFFFYFYLLFGKVLKHFID
jgi:hypothetical protein